MLQEPAESSAATEAAVGVVAAGRHEAGRTRPSMHRRQDEQGEKEEARAGAFLPGKGLAEFRITG